MAPSPGLCGNSAAAAPGLSRLRGNDSFSAISPSTSRTWRVAFGSADQSMVRKPKLSPWAIDAIRCLFGSVGARHVFVPWFSPLDVMSNSG